ncbi:hypothetical protein H4219_002328 [Mycoemilia scoparia]|uniref:Uncharacterized protein n=1 Tax=Mycoemilia scoparia TaxID=417184 RepID=A0A9W7ZYK9_9FUNG|nr:hypothetical protein H4219_002328 [Mycoemilia scoparia]
MAQESANTEPKLPFENEQPQYYDRLPLQPKMYHDPIPFIPLPWIHSQRNQAQIMIDYLFIGDYISAKNADTMRSHQVRHAVCILDPSERLFIKEVFPKNLYYYFMEVPYNTDYPFVAQKFEEFAKIIEPLLLRKETVLVYCANGQSRSPSFVISYLIKRFQITFPNALKWCQNQRLCIHPTPQYEDFLRQYQASVVKPKPADYVSGAENGNSNIPTKRLTEHEDLSTKKLKTQVGPEQ